MSTFSAALVAPLSYDFRHFPQDDSDERCTGHGRIPEPSKAVLEAFWNAQGEVLAVLAEAGDDADEETVKETVEDAVYQRISDVCSGKPSVDELKQLPPRILFKFAVWLTGELAPKA